MRARVLRRAPRGSVLYSVSVYARCNDHATNFEPAGIVLGLVSLDARSHLLLFGNWLAVLGPEIIPSFPSQ